MKIFLHSTYTKVFPALLVFGVAAGSCKKIIQIPAHPPSQIPSATVFADSADIMSAVAGIYSNFGASSGSGFSSNITLYTGLTGDELNASGSGDPSSIQFLNNGILGNNSNVSGLWMQAYSDLYQVNACLDGIGSNTVISASLKQQLTGEIEVVRALYYFNLVNLFGPVPVVLSTDYTATAKLPRVSVDSVYDQIIADLTGALKLLTVNYPSDGRARPNVYTAMALLAKVYLYRGAWQSADSLATIVIGSGSFSLETDLNNVFLDGSAEAIWQLPANGLYYQTPDPQNFVPYADGVIPSYPVSDFLQHSFEAGDQRVQKWIGIAQVDESGNGNLTSYYYPDKYKNRDAASATTEDYMVLRLGELYLIRAEASAELNQLTEAVADINMVRQRAGLAGSTANTQPQVLAAVMHERQTELFCEWGNRWFDLIRSGTIDAVLGAEKPGWKPSFALFPIPLDQMSLNPFLTQNPGY